MRTRASNLISETALRAGEKHRWDVLMVRRRDVERFQDVADAVTDLIMAVATHQVPDAFYHDVRRGEGRVWPIFMMVKVALKTTLVLGVL
jgi:hypothetical protein